MTDLVDRHIELQEMFEGMMRLLTGLQYETDQARDRDELSVGNLADIGYLEREMERLLDHHRKESKSRQLSIGRHLCKELMLRFNAGEGDLKVRGELANATAEVKQEPILPKKGDPEYSEIMRSIGVPEHLAREGAIQIHFVRMGEYLTRLANEGQNAPGRLQKRAVLGVTYRSNERKKKD